MPKSSQSDTRSGAFSTAVGERESVLDASAKTNEAVQTLKAVSQDVQRKLTIMLAELDGRLSEARQTVKSRTSELRSHPDCPQDARYQEVLNKIDKDTDAL
jgi:hypothetical protein